MFDPRFVKGGWLSGLLSRLFGRTPAALLIVLPIATGLGSLLGGVCVVALEGIHSDATTAEWVRDAVHILLAILLVTSPVFEILTELLLALLLVRLIIAVMVWIIRSGRPAGATNANQDRVLEALDGFPMISLDSPKQLEPPNKMQATSGKTPKA